MKLRRISPVIGQLVLTVLLLSGLVAAQSDEPKRQRRAPLGAAEIDDITRLLMLEDTRAFDEAALARTLKSSHPEVRADANAEVAATVVFSAGQLRDAAAVPWLSELLTASKTSLVLAREAAIALGKIQAPESRAALAGYLLKAPLEADPSVVGEALLSIGRFTGREDLAPMLRWTSAKDTGVRWRAAWALMRTRDLAAVPALLQLVKDPSADVRFWAVRGLAVPAGPQAPAAGEFDRVQTSALLRQLVRDPDRRVRTDALRALATHQDDASFAIVLEALDSPDTWLSVLAVESMDRFQSRADVVVPRLVAASATGRPLSVRMTALAPLVTLAPEKAIELATALAREDSASARTVVRQALSRLGPEGKTRLDALVNDPATKGLFAQGGGGRGSPTPEPARPESDYRRIVERWIVPDYNGSPRPRVIWDTARGPIELELYPGDSPLGVEHFMRLMDSGELVGTEFGRVVPNFVAQQRTVRNDVTLRDEVSRHGLMRANLSWASAGLDTGRPGYTLGVTPQPHNEGNFTSLGRVVKGMEAVERLELGDKITGTRRVDP